MSVDSMHIVATLARESREKLFSSMNSHGFWEGGLSSSAVSTAVAMSALHSIDSSRYAELIKRAADWLIRDMKPDGSWGDSPESPSNPTATLLAYAALRRESRVLPETERYLSTFFGGTDEDRLIKGVLSYYGTDLTFSVPILVLCGVCGVIRSWKKIPPLPFELSLFPQQFYRFLRLPVVSYAIPALIAVGILRFKRNTSTNPFASGIDSIRARFIEPSLKVLERLQPSHGGFLEAAPLTGFVSMCLAESGFGKLEATQRCASFLASNVREDGSWPIDTDLSMWVTTLASRALEKELTDHHRLTLLDFVRTHRFSEVHPFTGAQPGGFGWTYREGAVPDADDTSSAIHALYSLSGGVPEDEVYDAIRWLFTLQNENGGVATFCKGWGKLPFDRSSPDITAHAISSIERWLPKLDAQFAKECTVRVSRMRQWLANVQAADGSWTPLWFGDQETSDLTSPVYGTSVVCGYLQLNGLPVDSGMVRLSIRYLLSGQNADGGWGGSANAPSRVTLTAQALTALSRSSEPCGESIARALHYLWSKHKEGLLFQREPIGLYFAKLWYSEALYSPLFLLTAMNSVSQYYNLNSSK
ncbi:MAG: prenyltransferase/squalene oxidase repeat-containing protein [Bacteroidales bacterium]